MHGLVGNGGAARGRRREAPCAWPRWQPSLGSPAPGGVPVWKAHKEKWSLEFFSLKKKIKKQTCFKRGKIDVLLAFLHLVCGQRGGFRRKFPSPSIQCNQTRCTFANHTGTFSAELRSPAPQTRTDRPLILGPRGWGPGGGRSHRAQVSGGVPDKGGGCAGAWGQGPAGPPGEDGNQAAGSRQPALASRAMADLPGVPQLPKLSSCPPAWDS